MGGCAMLARNFVVLTGFTFIQEVKANRNESVSNFPNTQELKLKLELQPTRQLKSELKLGAIHQPKLQPEPERKVSSSSKQKLTLLNQPSLANPVSLEIEPPGGFASAPWQPTDLAWGNPAVRARNDFTNS